MITWEEDKIWMLDHWWLFLILILSIAVLFWIISEIKNAPLIEEDSYFNADFSGDFTKEHKPEDIIEQGRSLQKKYEDAMAMFMWPVWIWRWLKRKRNGRN